MDLNGQPIVGGRNNDDEVARTGAAAKNLLSNDVDPDLSGFSQFQVIDPYTGLSYVVQPGVPISIGLEQQLNVGGARTVAGTLMVDEFGNFSFATAADYNTDNFPSNPANPLGDRQLKFLYRAIDKDGIPSFHADGTSRPAEVILNVLPVNDAPVPVNDGTIQLLEDLDGEAFTVNLVINGNNVAAAVRPAGGVPATPTYTPSNRAIIMPASAFLSNDSPGIAASPTSTNENTLLDDGVSGDLDVQSIVMAGVNALNGVLGFDVDLFVQFTTFNFGAGLVPAVRIVPEQHAVGLAQFTYIVQDDAGVDRGGVDQATGTVTLEFKRVNDAPVPVVPLHVLNPATGLPFTVAELDDVNPPTSPPLEIPASELLSFTRVDAYRYDEPGPRRTGTGELIEEFAEQRLRIVQVISPTANGATVVGIDKDGNLLNGFEAIGYTPAKDFDSYNSSGAVIAPDTIEYVVEDYDPNKPVGNDAPDSWVRDPNTGLLTLVPRARRNDTATAPARVEILVTPVNDPPTMNGNPPNTVVLGPGRFQIEALEDVTSTWTDFISRYLGASSGANENDGLRLDPVPSTPALEPDVAAPVVLPTSQGGTVTIGIRKVSGDYDLVYQPPANYFGNTDSIVMALIDEPPAFPAGQVAQRVPFTLVFQVRPINDAPVGISDQLYILEDTPAAFVPA